MHALILAGGFATRLWPLTEKTAKPLIPIAGEPLINSILKKIPNQIPITISTNAVFADDFRIWKKKFTSIFPEKKINIFIEDSFGETQKKGALAATALFIEEKNIDEDLLLLAGDNYFGFNFSDFLAQKNTDPILAAYDIGSREEAKKFGVIVPSKTSKNTIEAFEEKPENPSSQLVSTGAYIFPKQFLRDIILYSKDHADDLGGVFEYFIQKKQPVRYFSFHEQWYDIGSFPAFLQANIELMEGKNIIDPSVKKDSLSRIHKNVYIEKNVSLENVSLENAIILEGTILKNMDVKNTVIGRNCSLENMDFYQKIIRDNTNLIIA